MLLNGCGLKSLKDERGAVVLRVSGAFTGSYGELSELNEDKSGSCCLCCEASHHPHAVVV